MKEQNPDSQHDVLTAAVLAEEDIVIEKISGELASRPEPGRLLAGLEPGDMVMVTRLRRLGRNHKDLLTPVQRLEENDVDFAVLKLGIGTASRAAARPARCRGQAYQQVSQRGLAPARDVREEQPRRTLAAGFEPAVTRKTEPGRSTAGARQGPRSPGRIRTGDHPETRARPLYR